MTSVDCHPIHHERITGMSASETEMVANEGSLDAFNSVDNGESRSRVINRRRESQKLFNEKRKKQLEESLRQQADLFEAIDKMYSAIAQFRAENDSWKSKVIDDTASHLARVEEQSRTLESRIRSMNPRSFAKGDIVWYHRSSTFSNVLNHKPFAMASEEVEMLLVTVIGVHHDDFPNVYYTIQPVRPVQFINGRNNNTELAMSFFEEKQTDSTHLVHLDEV